MLIQVGRGLASFRDAARGVLGIGRIAVGLDPLCETVLSGRLRPGGRPVAVRFSGRTRLAADVERLFDGDGGPRRSAGEERCFEGRFLAYTRRVACTTAVDLHLEDHLLPAGGRARAPLWTPYLAAALTLRGRLEEQIDAVRSTDLRRRLRRADERGWRTRETRAEADVARFYDQMYRPMAVARFGPEAYLAARDEMQALVRRRGVLLLTEDEAGDARGGALLYRSRYAPDTLFWWKAGLREGATDADFTALETRVLRYAIATGARRLNLGLASAIATDGIFVHKRRLGCDFVPLAGGTAFRLTLAPESRAAVLAQRPLLLTRDGRREVWHGLTDLAPRDLAALAQRLSDGVFPGLAALRVFAPAGRADAVKAALDAALAPDVARRVAVED